MTAAGKVCRRTTWPWGSFVNGPQRRLTSDNSNGMRGNVSESLPGLHTDVELAS